MISGGEQGTTPPFVDGRILDILGGFVVKVTSGSYADFQEAAFLILHLD